MAFAFVIVDVVAAVIFPLALVDVVVVVVVLVVVGWLLLLLL